MSGWSILRWECEGEEVSVCDASTASCDASLLAYLRLSVGLNSVTLSGLSVRQLQAIEDAIRKARVGLSKAEGQARRAVCLKECPPVGSIVEHVTGGQRGKIFDGGVPHSKGSVRLQTGENRVWRPDTWLLVAAADADGVVNAEPA